MGDNKNSLIFLFVFLHKILKHFNTQHFCRLQAMLWFSLLNKDWPYFSIFFIVLKTVANFTVFTIEFKVWRSQIPEILNFFINILILLMRNFVTLKFLRILYNLLVILEILRTSKFFNFSNIYRIWLNNLFSKKNLPQLLKKIFFTRNFYLFRILTFPFDSFEIMFGKYQNTRNSQNIQLQLGIRYSAEYLIIGNTYTIILNKYEL